MKTKNDSKENLKSLRHSCEHVLTQAMLSLYPNIIMAMGPATDEGFYFDFDLNGEKITESDFPKIEEEMKKIVEKNLPITRKELEIKEAEKLFKGNEYKQEWLDEIQKRGEKATVYWTGKEFVDLCAGPHVESTGEIGAFKLLSMAGAYWHGDEKNKMLTRIYGTAFPTQKELDEYLKMLEEAEKRNHKKIGLELELFMFHSTAPGMAYWLPKGVILYNELINFWREEHKKYGYQEIFSPLINKKELYEISGHWEHYLDDMFISETSEGEIYALKPMNCPNAMIVFGSKTRSYRELPLRLSDTDCLHRFEKSGTLNGLLRIREFRQDDAHIFVREDQIKKEFENLFEITEKFYSIFGLKYRFRLGTMPESHIGEVDMWDKAVKELQDILEESKKEYSILEGDGAFYGPKIDILMKDSLGREWQMGTLQLDFQLPTRFKLKYSAEDGTQKTPVVIHRVIYGSLERFIGIITEHFAGAFPVWLSPVQVKVLSITDRNVKYAKEIEKELKNNNIRVELDDRNETLSAKIRDGQEEKVPFMVIVGDKEEKAGKIAVRKRDGEDLGQMDLDNFLKSIKEEIEEKRLT